MDERQARIASLCRRLERAQRPIPVSVLEVRRDELEAAFEMMAALDDVAREAVSLVDVMDAIVADTEGTYDLRRFFKSGAGVMKVALAKLEGKP